MMSFDLRKKILNGGTRWITKVPMEESEGKEDRDATISITVITERVWKYHK